MAQGFVPVPERKTKGDTLWVFDQNSGAWEQTKFSTVVTKEVVRRLTFSGVDPSYFSREQLDQLGKDGRVNVYTKPTAAFFPINLFPIITRKMNRGEFYEVKDNVVRPTKVPILEDTTNYNALHSVIFLVLVFVALLWLAAALAGREYGRRKMIIFLSVTTVSLLIVAIVASWLGSMIGLVLGLVWSGFAGTFFGKPREGERDKYPFLGFTAAGAAGLFVGIAAGSFSETGKTLEDPEFTLIWEYIFYYFLAGAFALGVREIIGLPKRKPTPEVIS